MGFCKILIGFCRTGENQRTRLFWESDDLWSKSPGNSGIIQYWWTLDHNGRTTWFDILPKPKNKTITSIVWLSNNRQWFWLFQFKTLTKSTPLFNIQCTYFCKYGIRWTKLILVQECLKISRSIESLFLVFNCEAIGIISNFI